MPAAREGMITVLRGLGRLLTAKQWERAAIVYAWTRNDGRGKNTRIEGSSAWLADQGFARLSEDRIRMYRKAWESAALKVRNDEMLDSKPGALVELELARPTR